MLTQSSQVDIMSNLQKEAEEGQGGVQTGGTGIVLVDDNNTQDVHINVDSEDKTKSDAEANVDSVSEINMPPVEGKRAWLVVFGSFCMHFVILGGVYAYGVYVVPYSEQFGITRTETSVPYTVLTFVMFLGGTITGRLADMYGIKPVFGVGVICWGAGYLIAAFATEFWMIILGQGVLAGVGSACCFWPGVAIVPQWFEERRALALGLAVLGSGIGNIVFGILIEFLISSYGTQTALLTTFGIGTSTLSFSLLCLKRRVATVKKGGLFAEIAVMKERTFLVIMLCGLLFNFGYHIPFVYIAAFAEDAGLSSSFAAICVGLIGAGSAFGRVILGFVADKIGHLRAFQLCLGVTGVTLFIWPIMTMEGTLATFALLFGFFSGGFIALNPVVLAQYYGVARLGGISGLLSIGLIPGSIAGPTIFGALFDSTNEYLTGILIAATTVVLSFLATLALPSPNTHLARQAESKEGRETAESQSVEL